MRTFRHFLIMMILCPWVGGTIVCYGGYLNSKVTDFPSAVSYLSYAAGGAIFGLLLTFIIHATVASVSYFPFMIIHHMNTSNRQKVWWISVLTFIFAILEGIVIVPIARDIGSSYVFIVAACIISAIVGAWLNCLNWLAPEAENKEIQQDVASNL